MKRKVKYTFSDFNRILRIKTRKFWLQSLTQTISLSAVPRKFLPGVPSRSHHGVFLCVSQLVLGSLLVVLAVWRMTLQDQLVLSSDWPLYSCVPLLCSGWVDIWLVCCCRYYYPGTITTTRSTCPAETSGYDNFITSIYVATGRCWFIWRGRGSTFGDRTQ